MDEYGRLDQHGFDIGGFTLLMMSMVTLFQIGRWLSTDLNLEGVCDVQFSVMTSISIYCIDTPV